MKRLVDIDDDALQNARTTLGLRTIKDTVNAALRLAAGDSGRTASRPTVDDAMAALATVDFDDRSVARR